MFIIEASLISTTSIQPNYNRHLLVIFVVVVVVAMSMLKLYNVFNGLLHWDTDYYLNIGTAFIDRNTLTPLMWRLDPHWNIISGSGSGFGVIFLALWLKLFGLSVINGQLLMYVVGLATLPVVYVLLKQWWNEQSALWGLLFFVLSNTFFEDFYIRMDAPNIFVCTCILLLHITAIKTQRKSLHFLVGIALGLALEVHILALLYVGALSVYYFAAHLHDLKQANKLWVLMPAIYYGVGLGLALTVYTVIHILPNPYIYFLISRSCDGCTPPGLAKEVSRWELFVQRQYYLIWILLLGIGIAFIRRSKADVHFILLLAGGLATLTALNPPTSVEYTGMLLPLFAMGVGALVADANQLRRKRSYILLQVLYIFLCISTLVVRSSETAFTFQREYGAAPWLYSPGIPEQDYIAAIQYIRAYVPHDAVIMGHPTMYSDLVEYHRFLSYRDGDRYGVTIRGESFQSFWEREQPVIFLGDPSHDSDLLAFMNLQGGFEEVKPELWINKSYLSSLVPK